MPATLDDVLGLLRQIEVAVSPIFPVDGVARQKALNERLANAISDYNVRSQSLATATTDFEITLEGEAISFWTDGIREGITLKLNTPNSPSIPLRGFPTVHGLFGKIYLTWTAQAGRTLWMFIGRNAASAISVPLVESYPLNILVVVASTTAALADGATYTSSQFWCSNYGWLIGSVFADKAGTLYIDQSQDGTNYDVITSIAYTASSNAGGFKVAIVAPYARVRFTDTASGVAQATFRLYCNVRAN